MSTENTRQALMQVLRDDREPRSGDDLYAAVGGHKTTNMSIDSFRGFVENQCSNGIRRVQDGDENTSPKYTLAASVDRKKSTLKRKKRSSSQSSSRAGTPDGTLKKYSPIRDGFGALIQLTCQLAKASADGSVPWNEIRNQYRKSTGRHLNTEELNAICGMKDVTKNTLINNYLCAILTPLDAQCNMMKLATYATPHNLSPRFSPTFGSGNQSPTLPISANDNGDQQMNAGLEFSSSTAGLSPVDSDTDKDARRQVILEKLLEKGFVLSSDGRISASSASSMGTANSSTSSPLNKSDPDAECEKACNGDFNHEEPPIYNDNVFETDGPANGSVIDDGIHTIPAVVVDENWAGDESFTENQLEASFDFSREQVVHSCSFGSVPEEDEAFDTDILVTSEDAVFDTTCDNSQTSNKGDYIDQSVSQSSVNSTMNAAFIADSDDSYQTSYTTARASSDKLETSGEQGYASVPEMDGSKISDLDVSLNELNSYVQLGDDDEPTPRRSHEITLCSSRNETLHQMPHPDVSPVVDNGDIIPPHLSGNGSHHLEPHVAATIKKLQTQMEDAAPRDPVPAPRSCVHYEIATEVSKSRTDAIVPSADVAASVSADGNLPEETVDDDEDVLTARSIEPHGDNTSVVTIIERCDDEILKRDHVHDNADTDSEDLPYDDDSQPSSPKVRMVTVEVELAKPQKELLTSATWEKDFRSDPNHSSFAEVGSSTFPDVSDTLQTVKAFLNEVEKSEKVGASVGDLEKQEGPSVCAKDNDPDSIESLSPEPELAPVRLQKTGILTTPDDSLTSKESKKKEKKHVRVVVPRRRRMLNCCSIL